MKTLKKVPLKLVEVEFMPMIEEMKFGIVYYSQKFQIQNHLCVCGCGQITPFQICEGEWSLNIDNNKFTITPSVLQRGGCKTHYVISNSVAYII
jgi:hypothetical protein